MSALDIQPHSRGLSKLAVVGISLLAASSFAVGVNRAIQPPDASPFPTAEQTPTQGPAADPVLKATPDPQRRLSLINRQPHASEATADVAETSDAPALEAHTAANTSATIADPTPSASPTPTPNLAAEPST